MAELEAVLSARDIAPSHPFLAELPNGTAGAKRNGASGRLDKRQIEQRIEEDRERHKRMRESIWAVPGDEEEMERLWDELDAGGVEDEDYLRGEEDAEERRNAVVFG